MNDLDDNDAEGRDQRAWDLVQDLEDERHDEEDERHDEEDDPDRGGEA